MGSLWTPLNNSTTITNSTTTTTNGGGGGLTNDEQGNNKINIIDNIINEDVCIEHNTLPFIYWCISCQKGLCHMCDGDHNIKFNSNNKDTIATASNNNTSTTTTPPSTLLINAPPPPPPKHILISMNDINNEKINKIQQNSSQLSKLLNDIFIIDNKKQNIIMKLIEAINCIKLDLEYELINHSCHLNINCNNGNITTAAGTVGTTTNGGSNGIITNGVSNEIDYIEVQNIIKTTRSIKENNIYSYRNLLELDKQIMGKKLVLENYIYNKTLRPFNISSNINNNENYKLIHNYLNNKYNGGHQHHLQQHQLQHQLQHHHNNNSMQQPHPIVDLIKSNPNNNLLYPKYFIDMEINNILIGRIILITRPDIAPKMCENFNKLICGGGGGNGIDNVGYKGCNIFQCWKNESVITGDFEYNNGRGGYSIFNKNLFLPEDTKLISCRGVVGMRRTQKRHDSKGLVGSQFRIILQDMPGFTGIFGHVINGLNLIDKISEYGDSSGNPTCKITIKDCGVYI